jgi:hypothetical protein
VEGAHNEIGDAEGDPVTAEGARRCKRHHEHRGEHGEPDGAFLGIEGIRQPRIRRPGPPQHAEQQQGPHEATPRRAAREEGGHLGDGEDDDKVEEELEGRDPLFVLGLPIALTDPGHDSLRIQVFVGHELLTLSRSGFPN